VNIGYVYSFRSFPPRDGGSIHVFNVVRGWRELGCTVHTLGPEDNPDCIVHPPDAAGIDAFLRSIDVLCVRLDGRMLKDDPLRLQCLQRFPPRPIVWEINAPDDESMAQFSVPRRWEWRSGLREILRRRVWQARVNREHACRRRHARAVHAAVCVSTALARYATADLDIVRSEVVPNGSNAEMFASGSRAADPFDGMDGHFKVFYSGDFRWPWQGFDLIRQLATRAQRDERKIVFIVLNNSPANIGEVPPNIRVFDRVPYADVPAYLAAADACLCIYRSFSWSRHGFYLSPLKLFDYMAAGKPIVASRLGQIAEVIDDGHDGLLAGEDVDELYERLAWCYDHPDRARQLGEAARAKITAFYNWPRVARAMLGVFESVAGRSARTADRAR
jgi:glycosyltransferase involved in cell wall biosynthesis